MAELTYTVEIRIAPWVVLTTMLQGWLWWGVAQVWRGHMEVECGRIGKTFFRHPGKSTMWIWWIGTRVKRVGK